MERTPFIFQLNIKKFVLFSFCAIFVIISFPSSLCTFFISTIPIRLFSLIKHVSLISYDLQFVGSPISLQKLVYSTVHKKHIEHLPFTVINLAQKMIKLKAKMANIIHFKTVSYWQSVTVISQFSKNSMSKWLVATWESEETIQHNTSTLEYSIL